MIANLSHAVDRTVAMYDQLGLMWGPEGKPILSLHGLDHDQAHELWREGAVEDASDAAWSSAPYIRAQVMTRLGWSVTFYANPDFSCDRCRELLGLPPEELRAVEAVQMAGILADGTGGTGL